jgi:hypothetical protein
MRCRKSAQKNSEYGFAGVELPVVRSDVMCLVEMTGREPIGFAVHFWSEMDARSRISMYASGIKSVG